MNEKQVSQLIMYHRFIKKKNISQAAARQLGSRIHLKFNNKLNFFFLFKDLAYTEVNRDHDVISYLCHTVVTTAEPTSPPLLDLLPNFAVNKSRTVQESQEQQVWIY